MQAAKKFQVKIKPLKLEGRLDGLLITEKEGEQKNKVVAVSVKWKGPPPKTTSILVVNPFNRSSSTKKANKISSKRDVNKGEYSIQWNDNNDDNDGGDEFENVCDGWFDRWAVSFHVLYGDSIENDAKLAVLGKGLINLSKLASLMMDGGWNEKKIPITLTIAAGVIIEATLTVSVSFIEIRSVQDSPEVVNNSTESNKEEGFLRWVTGYMPSMNTKKHKLSSNKKKSNEDKVSSSDSTLGSKLAWPPISETQLDPVRKVGFWKKRRLSFRSARTQVEPLIEKTDGVNDAGVIDGGDRKLRPSSPNVDSITSISRQNVDATEASSASDCKAENCTPSCWEVKEIISRDGLTKLEANVFFASFDQCSQEAAGESACTTLSAVIAHWLQSNPASMPTRFEFDSLITEGSSEWRKLCNNSSCSPDKYFDLETILEAELRPLSVLPEKSFVGFFSPEKFESLKGITSFDEIWNDMNSNIGEYQMKIYIVSWNDHFFVLKVDADAYYIIDTLGGRLFEGCNKAYILKFDDSAMMYVKATVKEKNGLEEMDEMETTIHKGEKVETICSGKDCCREFIKRFLAAIPVKELEEEEKKGTVSTLTLLQRLQIEFQHTFPSPSLSSSATLSTASLF